jgi:hypothetical protein
MPALDQTKALEAAAQRLAKHGGLDFSEIRMVDHYLSRTRKKPNPMVVALVAEADAIIRPLLDTITDLEGERDLLQHRQRQCHTEGRNLADFVRALPDRLPSHLEAHWPGGELRAWLAAEVAAAPFPPYSATAAQVQP